MRRNTKTMYEWRKAYRDKEELMLERGFPEGRPTKEHIVREYLELHPNATKTDVVRNTGLSYDTVRKYWGKEQSHGDDN